MQIGKRWILFGLVILSATHLLAQSTNASIDSIIHLITPETYQMHFDSIRSEPGDFRKVMPGDHQSPDHDACRDYIFRTFQKYLGHENCYLQHFDSGNHGGLANVIGIKQGTNYSKGIWIVGAHYDSNNNNQPNYQSHDIAPGANDNGTGVAALLEIVKILSELKTEATIIYAAWDFEEVFTDGYGTGSNTWVKEFLKKRKATEWEKLPQKGSINVNDVQGNINFDMFGNPQTTEDDKPVLWACYAKEAHEEFTQNYAHTVNRYIPQIKAISYGRLIWSDHYTFAAQKIPSVENLESNYQQDPYYHTYSDNIENEKNIDFEFATNVTRGGLAYILEQVLPVSVKQPSTNTSILCRFETPNYYWFEVPDKTTRLQVYSETGTLVSENNNSTELLFNPPSNGWYYIQALEKHQIKSQIIFLHKKEGLF